MNQKEFLQIELNKTQAMIGTYHQLSKRKQRKRRYFEDYCYLARKEMMLKEKLSIETTVRYVGGEPKMEIRGIEEA